MVNLDPGLNLEVGQGQEVQLPDQSLVQPVELDLGVHQVRPGQDQAATNLKAGITFLCNFFFS